jgi:uroporphyrin-III C-methyltransferase
MSTQRAGKVYLIGAGPGDPDLLTIKAARAIEQCDVILYDRLVGPGVLAYARPGAELIYVGKHEGEQERVQGRIFSLISEHALAGKVVGRLKGGDPLVFGRGAEEWALALEQGIEVELIPGVTSAIGLPGLAGIPLTYRNISEAFVVITGHCQQGLTQEWPKYAAIDTLVILMGVKNRVYIAQSLIAAGRDPDEPVAFIERGASADERVIESDLHSVAEGHVAIENPAVFVIGCVVRLRHRLNTGTTSTLQASPG